MAVPPIHSSRLLGCAVIAMSVSITGGSGTIAYQWQSSTTGVSASFVNVGGATASSYQPPSSTAGITWYRVIILANSYVSDRAFPVREIRLETNHECPA